MFGHPILRSAIAKNYSERLKHQINKDTEVLVSCGASACLGSVIANIAGPGDEILMFSPFYPNYS
jgi:aminotransferase